MREVRGSNCDFDSANRRTELNIKTRGVTNFIVLLLPQKNTYAL